jgi:oxalate decarboxylase/phosphoglucose isomerase-like protein (cupin superfamily)
MRDMSMRTRDKERTETRPRVVRIDPSVLDYTPLLSGPPGTVTMRSGSVVLLPGQSVGKHSTGENEEAIVVLAGAGEMRLSDLGVLTLDRHSVAYCPPATQHDVVNTGTEPLRYVYVVAKAR